MVQVKNIIYCTRQLRRTNPNPNPRFHCVAKETMDLWAFLPAGALELQEYIHACPWIHEKTPFTENQFQFWTPITDFSPPLKL